MFRHCLSIVLVASACFAGLSIAGTSIATTQDEEPSPLVEILSRVFEAREFLFDGQVEYREPKSDDGFGGATIVIGPGGGSGGEDFEGKIEAWRTAGKELIIASKDALPGMAFFDNGDRSVTRTLFEEGGIRTGRLTRDISCLLDPDRLMARIKKVEWKTVTRDDGSLVFEGALPGSIIRPGAVGPIAIMAPRVLRVEASFVVSAEGKLTAFAFTVVRSDPMAGFKRQALSGETDGNVTITASGIPEGSQEEGRSYIYRFQVAEGRHAAEATRKFAADIREILENEVF